MERSPLRRQEPLGSQLESVCHYRVGTTALADDPTERRCRSTVKLPGPAPSSRVAPVSPAAASKTDAKAIEH